MKILFEGKNIDIPSGASVLDIIDSLNIDGKPVVAIINGVAKDIDTKLAENDDVKIITNTMPEALEHIRHSLSHVLALAIKRMLPNVQLGTGPAIENGFYYDVKCDQTFTTDDLQKIEQIMREILQEALPFKRKEMPVAEAIQKFEEMNEPFKVDIINNLNVDKVSIYETGDLFELCSGPHVPNTSVIPADGFKLTSVSGSYWRGDVKNDAMQRIYGTAWLSKEDLDKYFEIMASAAERDHRKLGPELGIFHIDEHAVGSVFWLKNGCTLFNTIKDFIAKTIKKYGYYQVQTPQLLSKELWETSGHWEKFRDNMFIVQDEDKTLAIKPMNCPGHIIVYKIGQKSYKDLPVRIAEFGICHRNESSGALHGIMRLRAFMQDDGHVICTKDQIVSETQEFCKSLKEVYSAFGFNDIAVKFSDRPEKRAGSDDVWDNAENALKEAAIASGLDFTVNHGEGAFYGPKLEFVLKDCLGRSWQCGTLQVDFVLPERFGIYYIDSNGERQCPVMIHRAIVGSIERFIGILIEHYAGKFPFYLAPVQIVVASITEKSAEYAQKVHKFINDTGYRCELDIDNNKINYKIREHSAQKIPVLIIVGEKEAADNTVSIRRLGSDENVVLPLDDLLAFCKEQEKIGFYAQ